MKTLVGEMPTEKKKKKNDDEITKDEPTTSGTNPKVCCSKLDLK